MHNKSTGHIDCYLLQFSGQKRFPADMKTAETITLIKIKQAKNERMMSETRFLAYLGKKIVT
jgi:hypothetical protein